LVVLVADDLNRIEEEIGQKEKCYEVTNVHVEPTVPTQGTVTAQQRHGAQEELALHLQQRNEHGGCMGDSHVVLAVDVYKFAEEAGSDVVAHKGVGDLNAADRL